MFYHLKITLRCLSRNFTYSAINIAGLATGITASVLIFFWVHHERSFDRHHPDVKRIYSVINTFKHDGIEPSVIDGSSLRFIQTYKSEIPEIESTAVGYGSIKSVIVNNTVFSVKSGNAAYVDRAWLPSILYPSRGYEEFRNNGRRPCGCRL